MRLLEISYEKINRYLIFLSQLFFLIGTCLLSLNLLRLFGLAVSDCIYFLSLFCAILVVFLNKRRSYEYWLGNHFLWPAFLFLVGAGISLLRSRFPTVAIIEIIQELYVMTFFVSLCYWMAGNGQLELVINAFIFAGSLAACVALIDYCTGARLGPVLSASPDSELYYRFAGTLGHPNKFGYFLTLSSLMTLGKWNSCRLGKYERIGVGIILFVQGFGLYLSGSVTAYLGFFISSVVMIHFSRNKRIAFLGIMIIAITPLALVFSGNSNILSASLNRVKTDTADSRWQIYMQAIEDIVHSPFIGVGSDQISTSGIGANDRYLEFSVHNVLLQIWYTGGLFAFIAWAGIYLFLGWNSVRTLLLSNKYNFSPTVIALAAAILAILLMDQFQDGIYQREKWLVFGLFVGNMWLKKDTVHIVLCKKEHGG